MNLIRANEAFQSYIAHYDIEDEQIRLKVIHTMNVCDICRRIAARAGCNEEEQDLAYLIGLLHDIGRFEQIRIYHTFLDAESENHALLGERILREHHFLRNFIEEEAYDDLIYTAIRNHNRYQIEENLSEQELLFTRILRDSDKLDIFRVNCMETIEVLYSCSEQQLLNDHISEEVYDCFMKKGSILASIRKTHLDILISHLAMVYDLNFTCSYHLLEEQGYYHQLLSIHQFATEKTRRQFNNIKHKALAYITEKKGSR